MKMIPINPEYSIPPLKLPSLSFSFTVNRTAEEAEALEQSFRRMFDDMVEKRFHEALKLSPLDKAEKDRARSEEWHKGADFRSNVRDYKIHYPIASPMSVVDKRHVETFLRDLESLVRFETHPLREQLAKTILAFRCADPTLDLSWTEKVGDA